MKRRTLLYVATAQTPDDQIAQAAEAAAQNEDRLICLLLAPSPALPISAYGLPPYGGVHVPDNWAESVAQAHEDLKDRENAVEALLAKANAAGDVQPVLSATLDAKHHVARLARVSDEAFFAQDLRDMPDFLREAAAGVLFDSPIAFRMNGDVSPRHGSLFVAWDGSAAASGAVHAALPYLTSADEVVVACIDPDMTDPQNEQDPGTDIAVRLSHHGCNVTVSQFPSGGKDIGTCIQDRAKEFGADLVVMGAYGHARVIQTVLGGTTRSMLEQTDLPVLFAH